MPDFPIQFRTRTYVTNQGVPLRSVRPYVAIQCGTVHPFSFIDSGAPFCVISSSVAKQIAWQSLGTGLSFQGRPAALDWQGLACVIGETTAVVLDRPRGRASRPLRLVGKFASAPHPSLEGYVLLGMNFLSDNSIDLSIRGRPGSLTGTLSIP